VAALRDKNEKLETRLRELIEVARGNDVLAAKIHRLASRLVRAGDTSSVMEAIEASLREDFGASEWLLLVVTEGESELSKLSSRHLRSVRPARRAEDVRDAVRVRPPALRPDPRQPARLSVRRRHDRDRLGRAGPARRQGSKQSGAALLAIGSPDAERFHPTMSTEFLARIGDLVSEAIGTA
jgi:uncharacterized protein YigA (DUF484 family)